MVRTGITGGIGSGKSYVCRLLKEQGISVYDCDSHAKRLMVESPKLRQQITDLIGPDAYSPHQPPPEGEALTVMPPLREGGGGGYPSLNKPVVTHFLMSSPENAHALEDIVHPAVIDDYLCSGMEWVESAILFESGLNRFVDRVVVVTAPEEVRIARVMERDGISREKAIEWINHQLPQDYLISHADHVIVNDGQTPLLPQLQQLQITPKQKQK